MDYAIYKTNDKHRPRIIHRFTQDANNHRAKDAARKRLDDMWRHVLQRAHLMKGAHAGKDEFQYDYITSVNTTERIHFYIAPLIRKSIIR